MESEWNTMSNFDSVEKLRERANVSYEDARTALDACGGDLLEALIYLEKQGKVAPPAGGSYSSKSESANTGAGKSQPAEPGNGESFTELMNRFFRWCGRIIHHGNTNYFEVWRYDKKILTVPITVLVLLLMFAFWVTLPMMVIGLFLSCRYSFKGEQIKNIDVNSVMDSAANTAENIKNEVINASHDGKQ